MAQFSSEELDTRFDTHDVDGEAYSRMSAVRIRIRQLVEEIDVLVPDGREKALLMTHLEEAMFWANAGIAREFVVHGGSPGT
jgi:hypothetical protein